MTSEMLDQQALGETAALAYAMAADFKRYVEFYRNEYKMTPAEAEARASTTVLTCPPDYRDKLLNMPPQELTWGDFSTMAETDAPLAHRRWGEVKDEARSELESGMAAYNTVKAFAGGYNVQPWDRARFVAIRNSLLESWAPVTGVELILIDTMAQAQTMYTYWVIALSQYVGLDTLQSRKRKKSDPNSEWEPPRVSTYEAIEQASAMIDRFNRLFLRTLRQLRDLRRYSPPVVINNPQQVNIGQQQVNVAAPTGSPNPE